MKNSNLKKFLVAPFVFLSMSYAQADDIDEFLLKTMVEKNIPGLQIAIVKKNKIIKTGHYGLSNIQDSVAVKDNTVFPINSMTKLFTGVAIMQLVEQNKLYVTDKISQHLTDLPKEWNELTVKQLLAHTSGLPDIMSGHYVDLIADGSPEKAWDLVQTLPMESETNTRFSYNQTGYILLGKIIDKLSGQPFVDFITENQLRKIDMTITEQAGFSYFQFVIPNQARQYLFGRSGKLENLQGEFAPFLRTAAGMSSTAIELAQYAIALQQRKILSEYSSLQALWSPAILKNGNTAGFSSLENGYALGWQVLARPKHPGVSASGANANTLVIYPEDDLTIVVLTNLIGGLPIQFVDEIAGFYIPEMKEVNGWGVTKSIFMLHKELKKLGFDKAISISLKLQREHNITFDVDELNSWGYKLMAKNNINKALEIFKLNVHLFPTVANTFDSLAETYATLGNIEKAILNYQNVLKLKPMNQHAKEQIKVLQIGNN